MDMQDNDHIFRNFEQAARATSKITETVTEHGGDGTRPSAVYLAIGCVSGALNILAMCVGAGKDEPRDGRDTPLDCDVCDRINADTLLFSAILTALSVRQTQGFNKDGVSGAAGVIEFGPSIILEALQMYERATGVKIDDKLTPGLVNVAREMEASGAKPLDNLMAERRKKLN
jgi:hypothetical protein